VGVKGVRECTPALTQSGAGSVAAFGRPGGPQYALVEE